MADPLLTLLTITVPIAHVLLAPYTKVEESFSLHAIHDYLNYGPPFSFPLSFTSLSSFLSSLHNLSKIPGLTSLASPTLEDWDHVEFPGAVPRSFVPPLILATVSYPFVALASAFDGLKSPIDAQIIARCVLALSTSFALLHLSSTMSRRSSRLTARFFLLFSICQFHIPFYAGRTLPNFFALPGVIFSVSLLLRGRRSMPVIILTALTTVVRLELALFVLPLALALFVSGTSLASVVGAGMIGGFGSLFICAPIDFIMWWPTLIPGFSHLDCLWPELVSAVFNILHGHASEWGVSPAGWYLTSAMPKLLVGAGPLLGVGIWVAVRRKAVEGRLGREVGKILGPGVVILIGGLSAVGHKEWRFIIYAIPILNILASLGASYLWSTPSKLSKLYRPLARLTVLGLVGVTVLFTIFSTLVSRGNYPGGGVWKVLDEVIGDQPATIHFHSGPLQTGASLFTFTHSARPPQSLLLSSSPEWTYSKSELPSLQTPRGAQHEGLDWVVTDDWDKWVRAGWEVKGTVQGLERVVLKGKYGPEPVWGEKVAVLRSPAGRV